MSKRTTAGRALISLMAVHTGVGAIFFDWGHSHVFNPHWTPHARFHAASSVFMAVELAALSVFYAWRRRGDARSNVQVAAWLAALYFLSFFPSALVPGAGLSEPGNEVPLVGGVLAPQMIEGSISLVLIALGYWLARPPEGPA